MRVKEWLESVGAKAVESVNVTIGNETWEGVRYHQHGHEKFYLVGMLPKDWEPINKIYYTLDNEEYHVCAWMQDSDELDEQSLQFHPFGNNWIMYLAPDDSQKPCKRQEMTVT